MASNDDNSRRDGRRPEDNPFIAFRRFADSQVSSLFDTVFGLPAMLARFNDREHAREQCLFGQADKKKCEELQKLTDEMKQSVDDLPALLQSRDAEALTNRLLAFSELEEEIDKVTQEIVEAGRGQEVPRPAGKSHAELMEKVGNRKGQQWGWSWDWGFPRPFDEEERSRTEDKVERGYPSQGGSRSCRRWQRRRERDAAQREQDEDQHVDDVRDNTSHRVEEMRRRMAADVDSGRVASEAAALAAFEELATPPWFRHHRAHSNPYSPKALEEDELFGKAGIRWRDAWEDLVRTMGGEELRPEERLRKFQRLSEEEPHYPTQSKDVSWEDSPKELKDEPSYEYGHDHEDQHDDPPTPKAKQGGWPSWAPTTELDAYEKLLGAVSSEPAAPGSRPSVLSTLTTTERSVAPDGTVTTKVVLKKRFADGREESSETVHTQKGQENNALPQQDPWKAMQDAQFPPQQQPSADPQKEEKKKGWFWTG